MAHRIRRNSMEHLVLYDLDQLNKVLSAVSPQGPPPIPLPRKHRRRPPNHVTFERYQFLCDRTRHKTDPVYAATPMFTIIPQASHNTTPRQLLGSYVRPEIVKPMQRPSSKPCDSESATATDDHEKEEEKAKESDDDDDDDDDKGRPAANKDDDDDDDGDDNNDSSSSSSDDKNNGGNDDDDILGDNGDDDRGIVEQIFNRDKN